MHRQITYVRINNMKTILSLIIPFIMTTSAIAQKHVSFYDFTVITIDGKEFPLSQLKGKKVLVVNTASNCGYTPQYAQLQQLYDQYGGDQFTIIGFPANNFLHQEPGTNEDIQNFCQVNYGVTFPMMAKISVKGKDMAPLYQWLTQKKLNGVMDAKIKWNFQKFMINADGTFAGMVPPGESPMSETILNWLSETR